MDSSADLVQNLSEFARDLGEVGDGLGPALNTLIRDLRNAVGSYAGLRVSLTRHDQPIVLAEFEDGDRLITTSLRIPLSLVDSGHDPPDALILYAGTPGAFVDLAADLGFALFHPVDAAADGHRPTLELDVDLPAARSTSGLSGLARFTMLNRAAGILLDQGHLPAEVDATLRRRADIAGVDLDTYAAWVVAGR